MVKRQIVHDMQWKMLPAVLFVIFMVGGILPTALLTGDLNVTKPAPEPYSALFAPKFLCNFTDNEFDVMYGIAVNPTTGNVYITNENGSQAKVLIYDSTGTKLGQIGGASGSGDNQFSQPMGIAVNSSGYIFVADSLNQYVKVYDSSGAFVFKIGTGTSGAANGQFTTPTSVAVNGSGYIYVSDSGQGGNDPRVQVFTPWGAFVRSFTFNTNNNPASLAINSTGHLYVVRSTADDVRVYTATGSTPLYTITSGAFQTLSGAAINSTGHVHISDAGTIDRVHVYDKAGKSLYTIGVTGSQSGQMNAPAAVAINPLTEHLYELDNGNNRVQLFGSAAPSDISILIDGGAATTTTTVVTLTLQAKYATLMCFSNDSATWTVWEPFATTKVLWVTDGEGVKTVYFKVRGESDSITFSDTITLDLGGDGNGDGEGDGDGDGQVPTDFVTGFLVTEYIIFAVLFGGFAVVEIIIPKLKARRKTASREEPTRLKAVKNVPDKR